MLKKISFIFFIIITGFCYGVYSLYTGKISQPLTSPLLKEGKALSVNQWFPKEAVPAGRQVLGAESNIPEITAKSAFFIDANTGNVLYSKNPHEQLPIASLTKVMSVLIALEHKNMDDKFVVSSYASEMEPDKMYLIPGETLTLKELLYGIFLVSANDAAETIAENTTGRREEFIALMNSKASEIGMSNTLYVNPTGLDEDSGNTHSSAYDLALLTRYLIRNYPNIIDISSTPYIQLPQTNTHQVYDLYSGINLLTTYPGVLGFKTGYTPEAGYTLITVAKKGNHIVIGVLLNSESRREEAKSLLDYCFIKIGI